MLSAKWRGHTKLIPGARWNPCPGSFVTLVCWSLCVILSVSPLQAQALPIGPDVLCLTAPYTTATSPAHQTSLSLLRAVRGLGERFPTLLETFEGLQPSLCMDERNIADRGYYDVTSNSIGLKNSLTFDEKLAILLHELRHMEQLDRGYCPSTDYSMKETARATFATEADAQAIATLITWSMKQDGSPGPWQAMLGWERYSDIPERFEKVLVETNDPGLAAAAAFEQWYASDWRIESYYLASCSDYLDRLDASKRLVSDDLLPADYLDNLCKMPDGTNYNCIEP